jgi:hypothetical protein
MTRKVLTYLIVFFSLGISIAIAIKINLSSHSRTFSENSNLLVEEVNPITDNLTLSESQNFAVLDAIDDKILVTIYTDYPVDSAYYNEVGYSSYSSRVFIYDLTSGSIVDELEISSNELCTDGSLTDNGMLCTLLKMSETGSYQAKVIYQTTNSQPVVVYSCDIPNVSYYLPKSIAFNDGTLAFSYVDPGKKEFGVQVTSSDGNTVPVYTSSKIEDFIGTEINGNGAQFIYYMFMDDTPTLLIGTTESAISIIPLESSQSMHSFCLADNYIFVSLQTKADQSIKDEVLLLDLAGEILFRQEGGPYFNATYDKATGFFATDMKYNAYSIIPATNNGALSWNRKGINLPNDTVAFFPTSSSTCIVTCGDFQPKILQISAY